MSVRFDATADALSRTTNLPSITSFTMMGWFLLSVDKNASVAFLTLGHATTAELFYGLGCSSTGTTLQVDAFTTFTNGSTLALNTWYHLALTVAGSGTNQVQAYLNGVLDITRNGDATISAGKLWVGNSQDANYLNGRACAIKVWNAVLTAEEIRTEMRQMQPVRLANINTWSPLLSHLDLANYAGTGDWTAGGTLATEAGPPLIWARAPRLTWTPAPMAEQTIAVDQASETATAQAMPGAGQTRLIGQASETATAQAVTGAGQTRLVGQAAETATAQAVTGVPTQTHSVGQASEQTFAVAILQALGASAAYAQAFIQATTVTIPNSLHGLGTPNLLVEVLTDDDAAATIIPGQVTVHPSTFEVVVTFAQPQRGVVLLSATGQADSVYGTTFTGQMSVTIPGGTHGLDTWRLFVAVYDASTPAAQLIPGSVTRQQQTQDVTVTFGQSTSGRIVLSRGASSGGLAHSAQSFTAPPDVTIDSATHGRTTPNLVVQAWSGGTPRVLILPDQVTVHPSTYAVVASFLQAQSGTVVIGSAAQGQTVALGQVSESALAQGVTWAPMHRLVAQASATDLAQAVTSGQVRLVAQASTTHLAQSIVWNPQHRFVAQAVSSHLAQGLSILKTVLLGQSSTTDLAQALTRLKTILLGQVADTNTAQAVTWVVTRLLQASTESATAQGVTWAPLARLVAQALSTATAQGMMTGQVRLAAQALEVALAQPVAWSPLVRLVAQSTNTESAQSVTWAVARFLLSTAATDLAQGVIWRPLVRLAAQALESALAQTIVAPGAALVTQVGDTALAQAVTWAPVTRLVMQALEAASSQALSAQKTGLLTPAATTELPQALSILKVLAFGQTSESTTAQAMAWVMTRLVTLATETDTVEGLAWSPQTRLVAVTIEADLAQGIAAPGSALVNQVEEADLAQEVTWSPQIRVLVQTTETAAAQTLTWAPVTRLVLQALEADASQGMTWSPQARLVEVTLETDLAQSLPSLKTVLVEQSAETASPEAFTIVKVLLVDRATEATTVFAIAWSPQARLVAQTLETDLALSLTAISGLLQYAIFGTWTVEPICTMATLTMTPVITEDSPWDLEPVLAGDFSTNDD